MKKIIFSIIAFLGGGLAALFAVCLFFNLAQAGTPSFDAVASVNGVNISKEQFNKSLAIFLKQGKPNTPQLRSLVVDQLITQELFYQAAEKAGIEKQPKIANAILEAKRNILITNYLKQAIKPKPVTDADIQKVYEKVKENIGPKEYQLNLIRVATDSQANTVDEQLKKGADFHALAKQYSISPSAKKGGVVGWISFKDPAQAQKNYGIPAAIAEFIQKTEKPGATSSPIPYNGNFYIVRISDVRDAKVPDYKTLYPVLKNALNAKALESAMQTLIVQLMKNSQITQVKT